MDNIKPHYNYVTTFLSYCRGNCSFHKIYFLGLPKTSEQKLLVQFVKDLAKVEEKGGKRAHYPYYMNETELDAAVRQGTVRIGKFTVSVIVDF